MSTIAGTGRDDYLDFCEGVRRLCTIDLTQYKRNQMERRIRGFAERRGIPVLADYLRRLGSDETELDCFLDRVTINVSQLWRNPGQWTVLGEQVVPDLAREGRIRAWSAGSSYGAEAYTLAAVLCEVAPSARISITGTDIDRRMIALATAGEFNDNDARDAPPDQLERWFERMPNGWRAGPRLRDVTRFELGDLLRLRPRRDEFDLILCRNTVIYFTEEVRDALHARLAEALRPGGYLLVGSTERVANASEIALEAVHPFTYRKL